MDRFAFSDAKDSFHTERQIILAKLSYLLQNRNFFCADRQKRALTSNLLVSSPNHTSLCGLSWPVFLILPDHPSDVYLGMQKRPFFRQSSLLSFILIF
jgi:hypothetical protein